MGKTLLRETDRDGMWKSAIGVISCFLLFPVLVLAAFAYVQEAEHERFMALQKTCKESGGSIVPIGRQQWRCLGADGEIREIKPSAKS